MENFNFVHRKLCTSQKKNLKNVTQMYMGFETFGNVYMVLYISICGSKLGVW